MVGDGSSGDSTTAPFPAPETVLQDHGFSWTAGPTVRMELEGQSHELSASYREDGYAHYVSDKSILISVYFFFKVSVCSACILCYLTKQRVQLKVEACERVEMVFAYH